MERPDEGTCLNWGRGRETKHVSGATDSDEISRGREASPRSRHRQRKEHTDASCLLLDLFDSRRNSSSHMQARRQFALILAVSVGVGTAAEPPRGTVLGSICIQYCTVHTPYTHFIAQWCSRCAWHQPLINSTIHSFIHSFSHSPSLVLSSSAQHGMAHSQQQHSLTE